jgi:hypothetical protein
MAKKSPVKETIIQEEQAKDYKRMDLAASKYGVTVAYFKQLINQGKLRRYKLNSITFIDTNEFERMIVPDSTGNHGPERAPQAAK